MSHSRYAASSKGTRWDVIQWSVTITASSVGHLKPEKGEMRQDDSELHSKGDKYDEVNLMDCM